MSEEANRPREMDRTLTDYMKTVRAKERKTDVRFLA